MAALVEPTPQEAPLEDRHAQLEMMYVEEYLAFRKLSREALNRLPEEERKVIMREAMLYASGQLADAETRSRMLQELEGKIFPM
ncbi:MAG: hypothetical protein NZ528_08345 [Caldilineales bacterium]|nr:hypothetical protein [Caldilineales bacterium]MDW8316588.1 hypothetical protein [Anaerolineae bacterium]